MPVPSPGKNEDIKTFVSRCVKVLADKDPQMPNKQRVAVCYRKFRDSKKKK